MVLKNSIHLFTKSSSENTAHLAESMPFLNLISEIFSSNMFSQYSMLLIFPQSDNDLFVLIMAIIKTTAQRTFPLLHHFDTLKDQPSFLV